MHMFKAMDIELNATADSMPVKCPRCHSFAVKTLPAWDCQRLFRVVMNRIKEALGGRNKDTRHY